MNIALFSVSIGNQGLSRLEISPEMNTKSRYKLRLWKVLYIRNKSNLGGVSEGVIANNKPLPMFSIFAVVRATPIEIFSTVIYRS